jgi:hypothetical protein
MSEAVLLHKKVWDMGYKRKGDVTVVRKMGKGFLWMKRKRWTGVLVVDVAWDDNSEANRGWAAPSSPAASTMDYHYINWGHHDSKSDLHATHVHVHVAPLEY